jgi:hypothetical protein
MEGYFNLARNRGQISMMKDIGQNLKNDYGYEYGIGDGGWPYIKPPSSDVIPIDETGMRARKEAVARQIAMDRAEREERETAANDTRGPIRRGAEGFLDALKAKLGDIEAGIGRGIQNVEESADYYKPEAVAARYLKKRAEGSAPAISPREPYFGERIKGRGEDIAASARHHQDIYGQDLSSQTGWVLGDTAANVGAGMIGGPYGVGLLDATAAYGRGEPLQQALGTGVISTASLEAGGRLGGMLEEKTGASPLTQYFGRAGQPVARYLGRSTGNAFGPQAVSIPGTALVYGKPQIPNSAKEAALDIAQALGLGFHSDRRAAVKRIAIDPGTPPDVRAALHAILNGEIPLRGALEFSITRGEPSGTTRSDPTKAVVRTSPKMKEALMIRGVAGDNTGIMLRGLKGSASKAESKTPTPEENKGAGSAERASGYEPLNAHPDDVNVRGGYRGRYQAALGHEGLPRTPDNWDAHHSIPQGLRGEESVEGIDLDHPSELRGVRGYRQPGPTTNVHSHITQEWDNFLADNPKATREQILNFRDYLDWRYGFTYWESQARARKER